MALKIFKFSFYLFLAFCIIFFYTKDLNIFGPRFYRNVKTVKNSNNILVLVNKNNKLKEDYVPNDLVKLDLSYSNDNQYLRKEAAYHFKLLSKEALKQDFVIVAVSTYRSYDYQKNLFDYYEKNYNLNYALLCAAKAGHSEHQTGLAVDVMGSNNDYNIFDESKEFNWMKENAHKFGFILRYPKGKENLTGFKYEPWHYRYVGEEVATYIYENDITFEEYKKRY